jgi:hypothetical protein
VEIVAPADGLRMQDASITIVARASDALSGVASASCNGVAAALDERGNVTCVVALLPGANDVVVEAGDVAGNSGSAGIRVIRTGDTSGLRVVPEVLGLVVGSTHALQVLNAVGPVRDVLWTVDNPMVLTVADGSGELTASSAGVAVVTASSGDHSASVKVTVYAGERVPPGATRWRTGGLFVVETPSEPLPDAPEPPEQLIESIRRPDGRALVRTTAASAGAVLWEALPAVAATETPAAISPERGMAAAIIRTWVSTAPSSRPEIIRAASRPKGGMPAWRRSSSSSFRKPVWSCSFRACMTGRLGS